MSVISVSRTSKQARQTVLTLIRDLILNTESPNLLDSCANACSTYYLDLSALLQEQSIEHHSAIYWAILNCRDALLASLLIHAAPLSQSTLSEIHLACLVTTNQHLLQSLRCQHEPFTKQMTPLSTSPSRQCSNTEPLWSSLTLQKAQTRSYLALWQQMKCLYVRWRAKGCL